VQRALRALRMEIVGTSVDGITNVGHTFTLRYTNERTQAVRVVKMLNRIEYGARAQLIKMPTPVLGDSVLRAIAVLKNCRMLAAAECFDLLSPIRIAAMCHFLEGITIEEVDALMAKAWNEVVDLVKRGEKDLSEEEANARDREDMVRAEVANKSFERVILSERGAEELRK
jgi:protein-arginine kinase